MMSDDTTAARIPEGARTVSEVNAMDEDQRAAYREEQKRRREMKSDKANDLFKPRKKLKDSVSDRESLSAFMRKNITLKPLAMTPREYSNKDPKHKKYEEYLGMSCVGSMISIPCYKEIERIDGLKEEYRQLKNDPNEPSDFIEQATRLQNEIMSAEPKIKEEMAFLADAVGHYHIAVQMRHYCKQNDDLVRMKLWKEIEDALTCIGVSDFIKSELERRKQIDDEKAREVAAERARKAMELAEKEEAEKAASVSNEAASESGDVSNNSEDVAMIKDKDGTDVAVESLLQPGKKSVRDRDLQQKKKSVNKTAASRRGLKTTANKLCMTSKKFAEWLNRPWNHKNQKTGVNRSGLNKKKPWSPATEDGNGRRLCGVYFV
jgi:hypothetical protein